jgi:colicin import membrane protein
MSAAVFQQREDPGYSSSIALSLAVHALLLAVIFLGVRFQSHAPDTVTVELWEPPQPAAVPRPPPPPQPRVEPQPPPPKPEPRIEKPQIVEKPAPKPKPVPKPEVKPEPPKPKPKPDDRRQFQREVREQLAQEQAAAQERQLKELLAREQAAASSRALATWTDKIRAKIRSKIPVQVAQAVAGNPEAIYDVTLLPTGEVLSAKMRQSSGNKPYDEAVERAILGASPLPKPEPQSLFQRQLELRFRPQDK